MRRQLRILSALALLFLLAAGAGAQELLSRPEIEGHATPTAEFPEPHSASLKYADVAVLAVALGLSVYLALVRRSRRGLFLLAIGSLAYFGFYRQGCVCAIGSIQNVVLALSDSSYGVSLAILAFFALPLVATLFFGRTFCAAVCPLGAIQELFALRPVRVPAWLDQALGLAPYVYLGAAVVYAATGTAFIICEYDPFVAFFRLSGSANMLILGACFLVIGLFIGRPYCRYLCPYGALLKPLSRLSRWHVRIPPEECINCRLCEDACPYGAIHPPTVKQSDADRKAARTRLVLLLALSPVMVAAAGWAGRGLGVPLSRLHPESQLAERIRLEETGQVEGTTDASDAFYSTGRPRQELYAAALALHERFSVAGMLLGGWVALVIAVKLIHTNLRRQRSEYSAEKGNCVSCGRCFWYCPAEQVRLGLIENVDVVVKRPPAEEGKS